MLTREFKLKLNRKLKRQLSEHLWHLTGVYNWSLSQIEKELQDHQTLKVGPLPEGWDEGLARSKVPNRVRLKPL